MKPPPIDEFSVRACALEQAVKLYAGKAPSPTNPTVRNGEIITAATAFELYLAGQSPPTSSNTPVRRPALRM